MTNTITRILPLPRTWSWNDRDGCTHMVTEATPLEPGLGAEPHVRALCGGTVPAGFRAPGTRQCGTCHERLTELLDRALGSPAPDRPAPGQAAPGQAGQEAAARA